MRLIVLSESDSFDTDECVSIFGRETELAVVNCFSEVERMSLTANEDALLLLTSRLTDSALAFMQRLMRYSAIPLLVSAQEWQHEDLKCLLECGRVTFVPGQLDLKRLRSVVELARLRFEGAGTQLEKISTLENALRAQKQMAKVKAKLQAEGLTESQAHELLRSQAMKQGISLDQFVGQLA